MAILVWIGFGLVVGLLARAILPGDQPIGLVWTTLLGIVGSLLGGLCASLLQGGQVRPMTGAGFFGSLLGAILVLALFSTLRRPPGTRTDRTA